MPAGAVQPDAVAMAAPGALAVEDGGALLLAGHVDDDAAAPPVVVRGDLRIAVRAVGDGLFGVKHGCYSDVICVETTFSGSGRGPALKTWARYPASSSVLNPPATSSCMASSALPSPPLSPRLA